MPAQLVALNDGPNILLDKPILLVGRHPECDIQIDSRKISRRHCCIAQVSDYLVVRDLGSTNGVRINGVRVTEGRLNAGDELTVGNHRYQVAWEANLLPPRRAAAPQQPLRDAEDFIESSDQPIALPEPGGRPFRAGDRPFKTPIPPKTEKDRADTPPSHENENVILPEHLDLAPSDVLPAKEG